jgi:hypothetical protein
MLEDTASHEDYIISLIDKYASETSRSHLQNSNTLIQEAEQSIYSPRLLNAHARKQTRRFDGCPDRGPCVRLCNCWQRNDGDNIELHRILFDHEPISISESHAGNPRQVRKIRGHQLELSLLLSKILWVYNIELMNTEVDWLRDSKIAMLWKKPKLMIKTTRRQVAI